MPKVERESAAPPKPRPTKVYKDALLGALLEHGELVLQHRAMVIRSCRLAEAIKVLSIQVKGGR